MSLSRFRALADAQVLRAAAESVAAALEAGRGVHLGEAAVASLKVHTVDPRRPQELHVLMGSDAGQVFYHRRRGGEVIHLDVFHQLGAVDHRAVARALGRAVEAWAASPGLPWAREFPDRSPTRVLDYVDVQTATGGGRCTGSLKYGRRVSVRYAHSNHVHVAARLPREMLGLLLFLRGCCGRAGHAGGPGDPPGGEGGVRSPGTSRRPGDRSLALPFPVRLPPA